MALLDLPNELLQYISENLKFERDINALTRTNRRLYILLNPYLYRHNVRLFRSSALEWAAEWGQEGTAQKLLGAGANAKTMTIYGNKLLLLAARSGNKIIVEHLLAEDNVNPYSKVNQLQRPLSLAAERGHEAVVKLLLSKDDVDPDSKDFWFRTQLSCAEER
jgi:ankyrin repeat protein